MYEVICTGQRKHRYLRLRDAINAFDAYAQFLDRVGATSYYLAISTPKTHEILMIRKRKNGGPVVEEIG